MKNALIITCGFSLGIACPAPAETVPPSPGSAVTKSGKILPYAAIVTLEDGPKHIEYDIRGMRPLSPVPPPGIHPRILHSPADRAALVKAYAETPYGRFIWKLVNAWTAKLKGTITDRSDYPTYPDGQILGPFNRDGWTQPAADYQQVLAGNMEVLPDNLMNSQMLGLICLELYRCWIEEDTAAGRIAATALAEIAAHLAESYQPGMPTSEMGSYHIGLGYDYGHPFMTDAQRDTVRGLIASASVNKAHYGAFVDCDGATSNWCTLDSFMPFTLLAIGGEEGFNRDYYRTFAAAYQKFISYGWYKSGVPYEGLVKNYQFNEPGQEERTTFTLTRGGNPVSDLK